jgi:hypothetical protein
MGAQFDLVAFTTATTGTGTITVGTALTGCRTPAGASIPDGTTVSYALNSSGGAQLETGIGVIGGGSTTMTRSLRASTTGSLLNLAGATDVYFTPIAEDFAGGGAYEVADWAALQALSGVPDGRVYVVLAPVVTGGTRGTQWVRDGSVWRPASAQALYTLRTPIAGTAGGSLAQSLLAPQISAGVLPACGRFRVLFRLTYSGADSGLRNVRLFIASSSTLPGSGNEFFSASNIAANVRQISGGRAFQCSSNTTLRYSDAGAYVANSEYGIVTSALAVFEPEAAQANMAAATFLHLGSYQAAGFSATVTLDQFTLLVE